MNPFYITINGTDQLMIMPDIEERVDGHPILTYIYSIFDARKGGPLTAAEIYKKEHTMHLDKSTNKNYFGCIKFDVPGKMFTYIPGDLNRLTSTEIEEVIQNISHYRDNPQQWSARF